MMTSILPFSKKTGYWLLAILLLGLVIRLAAAYVQPAFLDEAFVYYITKAGPGQAIHRLRIDTHPPTYNLIMYPLVSCTANIFILRLPSLLLSIITLYLSFLFARRFYNDGIALGITAFMALNYNIWITDAQLRTYGPLTLCLTIVWLGMLNIYRHGFPFAELWPQNSNRGWIVWFLAALTGASLHTEGAIVLAGCIIAALYMPHKRRQSVILLGSAAVPVSIWTLYNRITITIPTQTTPNDSIWQHFTGFGASPLNIANWEIREFYALFSDSLLSDFFFQFLSICAFLLALFLWILFLSGWIKLRREKSWEADFLGINAVFAPFFIFAAACLGFVGYTQARYAVPLTLPFLITALQCLSLRSQKQVLTALIAPSLIMSLIFPFCPFMWNQNWKPTLDFIAKNQRAHDIILTNGHSETDFSLAMAYDAENVSYTFRDDFNAQFLQKKSPGKLPIAVITPDMLNEALFQDLRGYRIILVMGQLHTIPGNYEILNWMNAHYKLTDEFHQPSLKNWAALDTYIWEQPKERHDER